MSTYVQVPRYVLCTRYSRSVGMSHGQGVLHCAETRVTWVTGLGSRLQGPRFNWNYLYYVHSTCTKYEQQHSPGQHWMFKVGTWGPGANRDPEVASRSRVGVRTKIPPHPWGKGARSIFKWSVQWYVYTSTLTTYVHTVLEYYLGT